MENTTVKLMDIRMEGSSERVRIFLENLNSDGYCTIRGYAGNLSIQYPELVLVCDLTISSNKSGIISTYEEGFKKFEIIKSHIDINEYVGKRFIDIMPF